MPLWLVAPHPVHCRSALLTPHHRLFLLARQLLYSVSLHLSLSSALWTSSYAREKERSARVRPRSRSASLKRKCDVQPLDGNVQSSGVVALPSPLPEDGSPLMSGSYDAPNVYSAPQDVYSEAPNAYSEAGESVYDAIRNTHPPPPTLGRTGRRPPGQSSGPTSSTRGRNTHTPRRAAPTCVGWPLARPARLTSLRHPIRHPGQPRGLDG